MPQTFRVRSAYWPDVFDKIAYYRDGNGITHLAFCGTNPYYGHSRWSYFWCASDRSAGSLAPGDVDALHPWPTCMHCIAESDYGPA